LSRVVAAVGVSIGLDRLDPAEEELARLALLPVELGSVIDLDRSRLDFWRNLGSLEVDPERPYCEPELDGIGEEAEGGKRDLGVLFDI
jgi:hypothetical protein